MIFKNVCVEVRLASMMRAPSPRASRLGTLFASVRLALFKAKVSPDLAVLFSLLISKVVQVCMSYLLEVYSQYVNSLEKAR